MVIYSSGVKSLSSAVVYYKHPSEEFKKNSHTFYIGSQVLWSGGQQILVIEPVHSSAISTPGKCTAQGQSMGTTLTQCWLEKNIIFLWKRAPSGDWTQIRGSY